MSKSPPPGYLRVKAGHWVLALLMLTPAQAWAQKSEDCMVCHGDASLTMQKRGRTISLFVDVAKFRRSVHGSQACMDCHEKFNPSDLPHAKVIRPVQCQTCHDVGAYDKSAHGKPLTDKDGKLVRTSAAGCKDCHGTHEVLAPGDPKSPINRTHLSATCGRCHDQEEIHYSASAHGQALAKGAKGAPSCIDCHGEHNVEPVTSKESRVYKSQEAKACLSCHLDNPEVRQRIGPAAGFIGAYGSSVHGLALANGNDKAATCSSCHGAHDMKKGSDATSKVNRWNIPQTCAQCHAEIARTYNESIHGTALQWGDKEAPSCTDCHGEHQIYAPSDPRSRVATKNVSAQVCAGCHSSVQLTQKYGLAAERYQTFEDSFHGLASRSGSVQVANCASCHGVHNIKPSSDPASTINPANLAATCGQCHPGANENFTKGSVHVTPARDREAILYWIRTLYIWLIVAVIGGMLLHNAFDFVKKARRQIGLRQGRIEQHHFGTAQYLRMTLNERLQHATMAISFIVLVVTGFMLKFPDAWWVTPIRRMSEKFFEVRSLTHRIAGAVMVGISVYHLFWVIFARRGRLLVRDMVPKLQDARAVWRQILYYVGVSRSKPAFDRFGYVEKAEYWALVWGVVVMAGTGFIMWFDNYFINLFTKLGWDVARTIHYYEACLATLAIVVWHFYFVILNPNVYPMSTAWWNGMVSEEEMAEEHPLELERIRSEQLKPLDHEETLLPPDTSAGTAASSPAEVHKQKSD